MVAIFSSVGAVNIVARCVSAGKTANTIAIFSSVGTVNIVAQGVSPGYDVRCTRYEVRSKQPIQLRFLVL